LRARRRRRLGALILAEQTLTFRRTKRLHSRWRVASSRLAPRACPRRKRSSRVATARCSCDAPRVRRGRTCRTRRWPSIPAGWRHSSSARRSSTRSAPMTLPAPSTRRCPGTWRGASLTQRRPISGADRDGGADHTKPRRPRDRPARSGAVWAQRASGAGRRSHPLTLHLLSGQSPDPDHARPTGRWRTSGRHALRPSWPLSPPFLARRPRSRPADRPSEAGNVRDAGARLGITQASR
jgi:hypothetical protein